MPGVSRPSKVASVVLTALLLAGCGSASRLPAAAAQGPGSLGGCTDTWTGAAGDHDYGNPGNWSGRRTPGDGDFGCIPPGAVVDVNRVPLERAAGLINEGTLCVDVAPGKLAVDLYNGAPPGQTALPAMPGTTDPAPADCPSDTQVIMQGSDEAGAGGASSPAPSPPTTVAPPSAPRSPASPTTTSPAAPAPSTPALVD